MIDQKLKEREAELKRLDEAKALREKERLLQE